MSRYWQSGLCISTSDIAGLSHDKQTAGLCRCCGSSDIMTCVQDGHERIVRKLLKQGALPDALNRQGRTAAELAEAHGHFRVIATLEASRAQVGPLPSCCTLPLSCQHDSACSDLMVCKNDPAMHGLPCQRFRGKAYSRAVSIVLECLRQHESALGPSDDISLQGYMHHQPQGLQDFQRQVWAVCRSLLFQRVCGS